MINFPKSRIASVLLASTALAATATALTVAPAAAAASPKASSAYSASSASSVRVVSPTSYAARLVTLTNQARAKAGLPALSTSSCLPPVATRWAGSMAKSQQMTHQSLDNLAAACPGWRSVGENIAKGNVSADVLFTAWMNSPEHKANILRSKFNQQSVAVVRDSKGFYWVSVEFALR